jgi:hypothetical protein
VFDLNQSDDLVITTGRNVFLFDRERRTFRPHPDLGNESAVKAVSIHPRTGQIVYVQAEGTNWWAGGFHTIKPSGELRLPGERLYKARWNARRFCIWRGPGVRKASPSTRFSIL